MNGGLTINGINNYVNSKEMLLANTGKQHFKYKKVNEKAARIKATSPIVICLMLFLKKLYG